MSQKQFTNLKLSRPDRKYFGRTEDALELPYLIELQVLTKLRLIKLQWGYCSRRFK